MQSVYWAKMYIYKYDYFYLNEHFQHCITIDRSIKIFTAIASSVAIAAWAAWTSFAFFWGLIIAISQVIVAVNEFLPYKKRITALSSMLSQLSALYIDVERHWNAIATGKKTEEEINELTYDFAQRWNEIDSKFFADDGLPVNEEYKNAAENQAKRYFSTNFPEVYDVRE